MSDAKPLTAAERKLLLAMTPDDASRILDREDVERYEVTIQAAHALLEEARGWVEAGTEFPNDEQEEARALLHRIDQHLEGEG